MDGQNDPGGLEASASNWLPPRETHLWFSSGLRPCQMIIAAEIICRQTRGLVGRMRLEEDQGCYACEQQHSRYPIHHAVKGGLGCRHRVAGAAAFFQTTSGRNMERD